MNRNYTLYFVLLIIITCGCNRNSARSLQNIKDLHDCALLVRLPNLQDKADKLSNAGMINKAAAVEKFNRTYNEAIIADFNNNFDFTEVYFFYSDDTEKIKQGELNDVFINKTMSIDSSIKLDCNNYLIMDYGHIKDNAATRMSIKWIVKDKNFLPLQRPFPYHLIWGRHQTEILKFNEKFHTYYDDSIEEIKLQMNEN